MSHPRNLGRTLLTIDYVVAQYEAGEPVKLACSSQENADRAVIMLMGRGIPEPDAREMITMQGDQDAADRRT